MLITESQSIREVIAFPKTQTVACVMMAAPGAVEEQQLRDLHIRLRQQPTKAEQGWGIRFASWVDKGSD